MEPNYEKADAFVNHLKGMFNLSNNMAIDENLIANALADEFLTEHRTLQQGMIRILGKTLQQIAEKQADRGFDLRNEASYKWIDSVSKIDQAFPFI